MHHNTHFKYIYEPTTVKKYFIELKWKKQEEIRFWPNFVAKLFTKIAFDMAGNYSNDCWIARTKKSKNYINGLQVQFVHNSNNNNK